MMFTERRIARASTRISAFGFASIILFTLCLASAQTAAAQRGGRVPNYGRLEVSTTPGGNPIIINGQPAGETTISARQIDLPPGRHSVEIVFPNGTRWAREFDIVAGRRECIALNYAPRTISIPRSPCPYSLTVSAPNGVNDGDVITFAASAAYNGQSPLNYTWTVSPPSARILSGAGTPTISVDTTGMGNQRVTAILVVDDGSGDRNCRQAAQATTGVLASTPPPVQPRRFDEFPSISFDDDKARLDNLAIELQNTPGAQGHIIYYGGRTSSPAQVEALGARARNYLVVTRGIDASRLVMVNGGYREAPTFELWIVPQGATAPAATPTLQPGDIRPAATGRPRRPRRR